ncbi:uncharacterized protein LOC132194177 isoform X2 [Neocloeon triangulifer]|uniref:uncharacterized protein LOC132194177 isoform X2 n=1 Tax=Neocloeon triangulifer TaxID=2078957 RepID=UPI00286F6D71|nr:uncharacterized protein LOC132194177 isoform X2 [Neocloeon triangulifer]
MAVFRVCLLLALVAAALAVPVVQEEAPKETGRDLADIIEAAVTGDEDKIGLLPRVALKLAEAGARGKLKLKKLLPFLAIFPLIKLLLLPIAILFLKGLTLKALIIAKIALVFALINAGRTLFSGKGANLFSGFSGIGGASSDSYGSYDSSHGHDSYSSSSPSSSHHGGYSRSFLDEAEVKVNSMIEAAAKFFEGDEEPAKTQ